MNNLFILNEDEKSRILNLHEDATKKQYLIESNHEEVNELQQTTYVDVTVDEVRGTLTLGSDVTLEHASKSMGDELKLFKGTKFVRTQKNNLIAKTKYQLVGTIGGGASSNANSGNVVYYCGTGKFQVQGLSDTYFNEDFPKLKTEITNLCKKLPSIATQQQQGNDLLSAAKACGYKTVAEFKTNGFKCKTGQTPPIAKKTTAPVVKTQTINYADYGI
jgi:hypothetical protein